MRTCPAPGLGISRSTIWKSAPALGTCATFIGAAAAFAPGIIPPLISHQCRALRWKGRQAPLSSRDLINNFQLDGDAVAVERQCLMPVLRLVHASCPGYDLGLPPRKDLRVGPGRERG